MDLDICRVVAVVGDINSGKSNLAVHLLRSYSGKKKVYVLGYPKQIDNFIPLNNKNQLGEVQDGIIFIDELQRFFRLYDKNTSREFIEFVSFSAHKNNCLIFTTQLSQNLTKAMEAFVDGFCITRIKDLSTLKNGSRIKRVIDNCADIRKTAWGLFLQTGEYLEHSEYDQLGEGGIKSFSFQGIGKDWRTFPYELAHGIVPQQVANTNELIIQSTDSQTESNDQITLKNKQNSSKNGKN